MQTLFDDDDDDDDDHDDDDDDDNVKNLAMEEDGCIDCSSSV